MPVLAMALAVLSTGSSTAAVTADPAVTVLYVKGDAAPDQIQVDCRSGIVLVNGAPAADGRASCADLEKLAVYGFGGDDVITLTGFMPPDSDDESDLLDEYEDETELAVYGGDGNDDVATDASQSLAAGGAGDDRIRSVTAAVFALGGPGRDVMTGGRFFNFMLGGKGADRLLGGGGLNLSYGGRGPDVFEGSNSADLVAGGKGRDVLVGNGGGDAIGGQDGRDSLFGGPGGDLLVGGSGRDKLRGGPGRDEKHQANPPRGEAEGLEGFDIGSEIVAIADRLAPKALHLDRLAPELLRP